MVQLISYKSFLEEKLENPVVRASYEETLKGLRFGIALIRRREELALTQEDLAGLTGLKQPMISRYEKGQVPSMPNMLKLAAALNADVVISGDGRVSIRPMAEAKAA